jgi:hypothetical protein
VASGTVPVLVLSVVLVLVLISTVAVLVAPAADGAGDELLLPEPTTTRQQLQQAKAGGDTSLAITVEHRSTIQCHNCSFLSFYPCPSSFSSSHCTPPRQFLQTLSPSLQPPPSPFFGKFCISYYSASGCSDWPTDLTYNLNLVLVANPIVGTGSSCAPYAPSISSHETARACGVVLEFGFFNDSLCSSLVSVDAPLLHVILRKIYKFFVHSFFSLRCRHVWCRRAGRSEAARCGARGLGACLLGA